MRTAFKRKDRNRPFVVARIYDLDTRFAAKTVFLHVIRMEFLGSLRPLANKKARALSVLVRPDKLFPNKQ